MEIVAQLDLAVEVFGGERLPVVTTTGGERRDVVGHDQRLHPTPLRGLGGFLG